MNAPRVAVVSFLGGAVSVLPFAQEWFGVGDSGFNWLLFAALVASVALGFAIHLSPRLGRLVAFLAGPPEKRSRALVLVAAFAGAGLGAMVAVSAVVGSP